MLKIVLSLIMLFLSGCLIADSREESTRTRKGTRHVEQLKKDVANVITVLEAEENDKKAEENVQDADDDSKSDDFVEEQDEQDVQETE